MQNKPSSQELAQQALEFLDRAEKFEEDGNFSKAIQFYTKAAENLKHSGYLPHRIEDIYTRITELNNYIKQEKDFERTQIQQEAEKLQEEAFEFLEHAKKYEDEGNFEDAIIQYYAGIKLLVESGWTETQLENLKSKIIELTNDLEQQRIKQSQKEIRYTQQIGKGSTGLKSSAIKKPLIEDAEAKEKAITTFEQKKKREGEIQNKAFKLIDNAKEFEKVNQIDKAIKAYEESVQLLNSIGWNDYTNNVQIIIDKLKKDQGLAQSVQEESIKFEEIQFEPVKSSSFESSDEKEAMKVKIAKFEEKKKKEEQTQKKAFELIDHGKLLERKRNYNDAISKFEEAIDLLKSIGWDSYISPILNFIEDINQKQKREEIADRMKVKRQEEITRIQQSIKEKKKQPSLKAPDDYELKKQRFEKKKREQERKESEFYKLLNEADALLKEHKFNESIEKYELAKKKLETLGSGWQSYVPKIETTLKNILKRKNYQQRMEQDLQRRKEQRIKEEDQFRQQISAQLSRERTKLKERQLKIKEYEEEKKIKEQRKQLAFKYLASAQDSLVEGDFDKAIYAYQSAGNIFAQIHWTEELPLIENAIKEIEKKKKQSQISKRKELEQRIQREKEELAFHKRIKKQLESEREKLKEKELELIETDSETFSKIKNEAYNLLEEAELLTSQAKYDKAIKFYRDVESILREIKYPTDSIIEMINIVRQKKEDKEKQKEKERITKLQKEKEESEFFDSVISEFQIEIERLKQKEVLVATKEEMQVSLQKRKQQAFDILENAETFIKRNDYGRSLESYRKAQLILNELRFPVDSIKEMMIKVADLKKQKEELEELELQKELERLKEVKELEEIIEERQKSEKVRKAAKKLALEEREKIIEAKKDAREAANSLMKRGAKFLKLSSPEYDKAISLYIQARDILKENIGWEPEIKNLNELINDLNEEKAIFEQKRKLEAEAEIKKQKEYENFQELTKKHTEKLLREKEAQRLELQEFEAKKKHEEELKVIGFKIIDEAQKKAMLKEFTEAYDLFNQAIIHFKKMGWDQQIHFIQEEINKTKQLEEKHQAEQLKIERIQRELETKRTLAEAERSREEKRLKLAVGEVGTLADEVTNLIKTKEKERILTKQQEKDKIKREAKEFRKNMAKMIKIKQELTAEIANKEKE
ncbi:MAG: hypothetical protein GF353_02905, partial [Candidatus Lokiarchaeota archaeon]|nr:hypothetical protein [Candidatus Lokiarchaeota archaeon]